MKTNRTLNIDRSSLAAAVAAALIGLAATGEPAQAQRSEDPREYARLLATEMRSPRGTIYTSRIGCPADGAWEREAFDELYRLGEDSDFEMRESILRAVGRALERDDPCPEVEPWLREQLERVYRDYKDEAEPYTLALMMNLLYSMRWAKEQASHDLVRDIAMDADAGGFNRNSAASTMLDQRFGRPFDSVQIWDPDNLERWFDAQKAVLFELAAGPPLPEFEFGTSMSMRIFLESQGRNLDVEAFDLEYEERLIATGRIPPR